MSYLLDTCVISEFVRRKPTETVIRWMDGQDEEQLYISAITIGELRRGIERLPETVRRTELVEWFEGKFLRRFDQRILAITAEIMQTWGSHCAKMERSGRPLPAMDSLIIATALHHRLIVVTRNTTDFLPSGVDVVNPWQG
jgi:toxin FitB